MSSEHGFSQRLRRWLDRFGFFDDPFALNEADKERPYLPYLFVDRPYLHYILGDPARPQAAFLLAGRGDGKTATREMVAYECMHGQLRRRALAVRYFDFSSLLPGDPNDLSLSNPQPHIRAIVRATLHTLAEDVPALYFDLLKDELERSLLMGYVEEFADQFTRLKLARIVKNDPVELAWDRSSPREILETLANLVTQLGQSPEARYQSLYILVDRVDETAAGPQAAAPLLAPLVSEGPLLETARIAFKFFLPLQVGEQLRQSVTLRPDRLRIETIAWDREALQKMVEQRLSYYSDGRIARLEELCTTKTGRNVLQRLIEACEGSPRTLLRLCEALIHHHVARTEGALIDWPDLVDAVADFSQRLVAEQAQSSLIPAARPPIAMAGPPPESGLYLDGSGHVCIDGATLTPPLSDLEFRLLTALYQQAPEIVPHEALIKMIWPASQWTSMDEQNLRKLIARLRSRLEPESAGRQSRFIQNVRGRGYWLKIT